MQVHITTLMSHIAIASFGLLAIVCDVAAQPNVDAAGEQSSEVVLSEQAKKSPQQEPRKRLVKVLAVDASGVPSVVAVGNRIARVERFEDNSFRVVVDGPGAHTIKDFIGGTDDDLVVRGITRLLSKYDKRLQLKGYSDGQKVVNPDEEEDEWDVMGWFFSFSLDSSTVSGGSYDVVAAYFEAAVGGPPPRQPRCHSTCVAHCQGCLDAVKDVTCTAYTAIGALFCLPGAGLSIICAAGAGISCYAAFGLVRAYGCPSECDDQCSSVP